MPESYEVALFLHILGVFLLAASAAAVLVVLALMRRESRAQDLRRWTSIANVFDKVMGVSLIAMLLTGIWLVEDVGFDYGDGWINFSMTAVVLMLVLWPLVVTRKLMAIDRAAAAASGDAIPQVLEAQLNDPVLFATAHAVVLTTIGVIWNMTTKPGDLQSALAIVLAALVGAGSAVPMVMRQQSILERRA
jgi:uncharacterized membrane protein